MTGRSKGTNRVMLRCVSMATLALDVQGGDLAPDAPLSAAAHFSTRPGCPKLVLVGDAANIEKSLASLDHDRKLLDVVDAPDTVAMDADPKSALDAMPNASILVAARL